MEFSETVKVTTKAVSCSGSGGILGHPKVYLNMGEKTSIECPYCSRKFTLKKQLVKKAS